MKIWEGGQQVEVPGVKLFDQASSTVLYIGEARSAIGASFAAWQIKKIEFDVNGNPLSIKWANGGDPVSVWSDRAILEYA